MALAVNKNVARGLAMLGNLAATLFSITLDNSYPTGGYAFAAGLVKLGAIEFMSPFVCAKTADGSTAVLAQYNYTTGKLQCYWLQGAGAAQVAKLLVTGGQAAGIGLQVTPDSAAGVLGKTTAGNINITTALTSALGVTLQEVDNLTDLSAFSGRGFVCGKG